MYASDERRRLSYVSRIEKSPDGETAELYTLTEGKVFEVPAGVIFERLRYAKEHDYTYFNIHSDECIYKVSVESAKAFAESYNTLEGWDDEKDEDGVRPYVMQAKAKREAGREPAPLPVRRPEERQPQRPKVYTPETYVQHAHILTQDLLELKRRAVLLDAVVELCKREHSVLADKIIAISGS